MYLHMITDSHNSCTLGMTTKDDDDFGDHYKNEEREHVKLVITGLDSFMIYHISYIIYVYVFIDCRYVQ